MLIPGSAKIFCKNPHKGPMEMVKTKIFKKFKSWTHGRC